MKTISKTQTEGQNVALSGLRRVVRNALSMLTGDVTNRAATFVLYALIARYLGTYEFGQLSLGITLFQTFQVLAVAGLQTLLTREIAKDRAASGRYLTAGSVAIAISSLVSIAGLIALSRAVNYSADTTTVILLLSFSLVPYSLGAVCDAVFQAHERMHFITYANIAVNILKVGLAFPLLMWGYGLYEVLLLLLFSHSAILLMKWFFVLRYITKPHGKIELGFSINMIRAAIPFLGIEGLLAFMSSFNVILLSKMTGEVEVGLYGAASQILVPISLVIRNVAISVYPVMCRKIDSGLRQLRQIVERVLEVLTSFVLPTCVGVFFLAEELLLLFYGNEGFSESVIILQVTVWVLLMRMFTQISGLSLAASMEEKIALRILIINVIVNVVFGVILISQYGLMGATVLLLLVRMVNLVQHYIVLSRSLSGLDVIGTTWRPVVASAGMALYLAFMPEQALWLAIVSGAVVYIALLSTLTRLSIGGFQQIKKRYLLNT